MAIVVKVRIEGARETLAAFQALPKEASAELRDANQKISEDLARQIKAAATSAGSQSAAVAKSIRAQKDRVPTVQMGGTARAGHQRRKSKNQDYTRVADLMFGANFGSHRLKQFRPVRKPDYWFFTTVEQNESRIADEWLKAADKVLSQWGRGG